MLKKTITYVDFNNTTQTEDFYFNLTKAEAVEIGVRADLEAITTKSSVDEIMDAFRRLLKASYGQRVNNGKDFIKSDREFEIFAASEAYSQLFFELFSNTEYAAVFMRGILPADLPSDIPVPMSQEAQLTPRERSEAQMQGHRPAQQPARAQLTPDQRDAQTMGLPIPEEVAGVTHFPPTQQPTSAYPEYPGYPAEVPNQGTFQASGQPVPPNPELNQNYGRTDQLQIDNSQRGQTEQEAFLNQQAMRPRAEEGYGRHQ